MIEKKNKKIFLELQIRRNRKQMRRKEKSCFRSKLKLLRIKKFKEIRFYWTLVEESFELIWLMCEKLNEKFNKF